MKFDQKKLKYIAVMLGAVIIILLTLMITLIIVKYNKKHPKVQETVEETVTTTESEETFSETETVTESETNLESETTEPLSSDEPLEESDATDDLPEESLSESETESVAETEPPFQFSGISVPEGPVKSMIRKGLQYVSLGYGYSLNDRVGMSGNFDCSGFVASLMYTELGCPDFYLNGNPYTTGDWRNYGARFNIGDEVMFGVQKYRVTMKDTEDYITAWSVPGSIVVQYSPTNHPEKTMGHISIALGNLPYESTDQIVSYLYTEYGVDLSGTTITGFPMVYDQYGKAAGHTIFKINAQSVANCCIVDNNFASDPAWIEPVAIIFEPVYE